MPGIDMPFRHRVRVYYEDTDAGGVVYYANYLAFMERARTEYLRRLGFEQRALVAEHGLAFVVRRAAVDFLAPARLDDCLEVTAQVCEIGRASLTFAQSVERSASAQGLPDEGRSSGRGHVTLCRGEIKIACLDAAAFTPKRLPKFIASRLEGAD